MKLNSNSATKQLSILVLLLAIKACGLAPPNTMQTSPEVNRETASIERLILAADNSTGSESAELRILALEAMVDANDLHRAARQSALIANLTDLPQQQQVRALLAQAELALATEQPTQALRLLAESDAVGFDQHPSLQRDYLLKLGRAYQENEQYAESLNAYLQLGTLTGNTRITDLNVHNKIWNALNQFSSTALDNFAFSANSYDSRGWVELARIVKSEQYSMKAQLDAVNQWQRIWSQHPASQQLPTKLTKLEQAWSQRPKHIGLILPLQDSAGKAIQEGFLSAYYAALDASREVPKVSVYDSSNSSIIYPLYDEAVASGADLIIGPLYKQLVNQLQQLEQLPVPTLALNYADEEFNSSINLTQFGLAPEDEIEQTASLAWAAGYRNAAIITPQSDDRFRLQQVFADTWRNKGGRLISQTSFGGDSDYADVIKRVIAIDSSESRKQRLLDLLPRSNIEFTPRRRNDIDFIFLIANPREGRQIKPTLAFYFAEDIPVYALPSIYDGLDNQSANQDLDGIMFTDAPWILGDFDPLKKNNAASLRPAQGPVQRFRAMGIDSFRLYPRLQQFAEQDIASILGATGILSMGDNGRIHRKLEVARFIDGKAILAESAASDAD